MPSVGIDLLVTEACIHKVMGNHDACQRNHVWNIFVINIVEKLFRSKLSASIFALGEFHLKIFSIGEILRPIVFSVIPTHNSGVDDLYEICDVDNKYYTFWLKSQAT